MSCMAFLVRAVFFASVVVMGLGSWGLGVGWFMVLYCFHGLYLLTFLNTRGVSCIV